MQHFSLVLFVFKGAKDVADLVIQLGQSLNPGIERGDFAKEFGDAPGEPGFEAGEFAPSLVDLGRQAGQGESVEGRAGFHQEFDPAQTLAPFQKRPDQQIVVEGNRHGRGVRPVATVPKKFAPFLWIKRVGRGVLNVDAVILCRLLVFVKDNLVVLLTPRNENEAQHNQNQSAVVDKALLDGGTDAIVAESKLESHVGGQRRVSVVGRQHGRRRRRHAKHGQVDRGGGKAAALKLGGIAGGTGYPGCVGANGGSLEQKRHTGLSLGVFFARKVENVGDVEESGHKG